MDKLTQGQCEGFCSMCNIKDCHLAGCVEGYEQSTLNPATDRLMERILREEGEI